MKRTIRVKWGELRVGLLITVAIAALLWASFSGSGTSIFDTKVTYKGYLNNVNGLVSGAPVWIAGVEVGNVKSIRFVNLDSARQIEIYFRVRRSITNMITTDAAIKLGTIGFLGRQIYRNSARDFDSSATGAGKRNSDGAFRGPRRDAFFGGADHAQHAEPDRKFE